MGTVQTISSRRESGNELIIPYHCLCSTWNQSVRSQRHSDFKWMRTCPDPVLPGCLVCWEDTTWLLLYFKTNLYIWYGYIACITIASKFGLRCNCKRFRVCEMFSSFAGHFVRGTMGHSPDILGFRQTFRKRKPLETLSKTLLTCPGRCNFFAGNLLNFLLPDKMSGGNLPRRISCSLKIVMYTNTPRSRT